jgi:hypothetical protein
MHDLDVPSADKGRRVTSLAGPLAPPPMQTRALQVPFGCVCMHRSGGSSHEQREWARISLGTLMWMLLTLQQLGNPCSAVLALRICYTSSPAPAAQHQQPSTSSPAPAAQHQQPSTSSPAPAAQHRQPSTGSPAPTRRGAQLPVPSAQGRRTSRRPALHPC